MPGNDQAEVTPLEHFPSSSDQAPTAPEDVPEWLKDGTGGINWGLIDFDASPTLLDCGDIFSSDSGVPTSAPSAITNSSSPLTDVTTYPEDSGEPAADPTRTAMRVLAMTQNLTFRRKQIRLELEQRRNENRIAELKAELGDV